MDIKIVIDGCPFRAFTTTVFGHKALVLETNVNQCGEVSPSSIYYYGANCLVDAVRDLRARGFDPSKLSV